MRASRPGFCLSRRKLRPISRAFVPVTSRREQKPGHPSGCGGAGSSAALPLLGRVALDTRPSRGALHPAPRRSQRRLTPFFSNLLEFSGASRGND